MASEYGPAPSCLYEYGNDSGDGANNGVMYAGSCKFVAYVSGFSSPPIFLLRYLSTLYIIDRSTIYKQQLRVTENSDRL